jgi:pyrroline-5-carboxylate reductase
MDTPLIAFIGGGNMAGAIVGGLIRSGRPPASLLVVEPVGDVREALAAAHGVRVLGTAERALGDASLVVWAVKPQSFGDAARPASPYVREALHLSVMAGIRSAALVAATGSERIVRAMPNTPALIGRGIAGLYARPAVSEPDRSAAASVLAPTGELLWVADEADLDAVTALSGSGPAYMFYVVEAMVQAAEEMGLSREQGRRLALSTMAGSAALALQSGDEPAVLRARVTSKGGTTHAALTRLEAAGVKAAFVDAMQAARQRAQELGGS